MNAIKVKNKCIKMKRNMRQKPGADEVKEKSKIHNAECNDNVTLRTENGERIINDKDEMPGTIEELEMVGRWILQENVMKIKGTFLKR